ALVTVVVRAGISSGPEKQIRFWIVGAGKPSGRASVLERLAFPRFRKRFSGRGNGPETPSALTGGCFVGRYESANALVAARGTGNHEILYDERSRSRAVVLAGVSHFDFP